MAEDRTLSDRALYHSVIAVIAAGNRSQGAIAAAVGREQRAVQHPLRALEESGFDYRDADVLRSRRPIYRIADPIVRFHHVVTRRDFARFEDRRTEAACADARDRFHTHVLGPHFEDLARWFTFRYADSATTGGSIASVGPGVLNDPRGHTQHEIDIAGLAPGGAETSPIRVLGEAKYRTRTCTLVDLAQLEQIRHLLVGRGRDAGAAKLLLFSGSGFADSLLSATSTREDVELIDLERLYTGS